MNLIDSTPLPWNTVKIPDYKEQTIGDWEISINTPPVMRGYFRGLQFVEKNVILKHKGNVWMSTTPMEIESQSHALYSMRGTVVVVGGGLGLTVYNALRRKSVKKVILVEIDENIIELIKIFGKEQKWEGWEKLKIIHSDINEIENKLEDVKVDFLWMDIWKQLGDDNALYDTMRAQHSIKSKRVAWWGMEVDFVSWMAENDRTMPPLESDYDYWVESTNMPILKVNEHWTWAVRASQNFINY